jgi:hypothetical protein
MAQNCRKCRGPRKGKYIEGAQVCEPSCVNPLTEQRKKDNAAILTVLTQYLEANPDMRFSQALCNLNIVNYINGYNSYNRIDTFWKDEYYLEPGEIIKRMKE